MSVTFSTLKTQVQNTAENDDSEFTDAIPDFIGRSERRLSRDLDHPELTSHLEATLAAGDPFLTKPNNVLLTNNLYVFNDSSIIKLLLKTEEFIADYWPTRTSTGVPKYYANYGGTEYIVAPAPASTNKAEIAVVVQPATLSASNETNFFTNKCFDALFYACMVEATCFMKNYSATPLWEQKYVTAIQSLQNEGRRTRRDDEQFPASPAGPNTLLGGP